MTVPTPHSALTYRLAVAMLQEHGVNAEEQVADRADDALDRGDVFASLAWARIARALSELLRGAYQAGDGRA